MAWSAVSEIARGGWNLAEKVSDGTGEGSRQFPRTAARQHRKRIGINGHNDDESEGFVGGW